MGTPGRRLTAAEERELIRLRCAGWSIRAVAVRIGCDKATVHKYAPAWLVVEWRTKVEGLSAEHIPPDSVDSPEIPKSDPAAR